jgi:D-alanyl-D-alanine carboxypeptidase
VLVGLMIERATGHSLEHELDERIVRPLRLRDTSFPTRRAELPEPAARGYSLDLSPDGRPLPGTLRDRTRYSPSFAWASGNGVSSVRDLARFYRALLGGRLLTPELRREALRAVDTGQPGRGYGLGIERYDTPDGPFAGHDGDIVGFSVRVRSTLDGRHQAIVAVNAKFAPEAVEPALDAALEAAVHEAVR